MRVDIRLICVLVYRENCGYSLEALVMSTQSVCSVEKKIEKYQCFLVEKTKQKKNLIWSYLDDQKRP